MEDDHITLISQGKLFSMPLTSAMAHSAGSVSSRHWYGTWDFSRAV
jgi:hypothetical protein